MDYLKMTAPCGLDCFNCIYYLANESEEARQQLERDTRLNGIPVELMLCQGCRNQKGVLDSHKHFFNRSGPCYVYKCTSEKNINFCYECADFPCDHLHPRADRSTQLPHNIKVFDLCLIKKMGLDSWAENKAAHVREDYFHKWFSL
ncbi:MAG: DUF3795 domain-containing protein [Dehalococcoidales bacterium]|nr:MAG: DUF3795 domain-containing protein [Dehalococcoidales bacterium]